MNLADVNVVVTGGGRGIGRYLVDRLQQDAARIAVLERDPALCDELLQNAPRGNVIARACDVSDAVSVDRCLAEIFETGFTPDVLINNAGIIHSEPLVNLLKKSDRVHSRESWHSVMRTNLDSVFFVTSRVVERMIESRRKGVVISVSSIAARGNAGQTAYSASKAGVNALTRTWAKELGPLGLRFAAIAPGFMDTVSTHDALSEATVQKLKQQIPLRRLGGVEHIYLAIRHVIENDYVSGTVLDVDGGLTL
jgi:3-oxoacyl-[acyl-carrier protein] reductase